MNRTEKYKQLCILVKKQEYKCANCNKYLDSYYTQRAHLVPQKKWLIKKYGKDIIDSIHNLRAVCSLECNRLVQLKEHEYEKHINEIKTLQDINFF